MQWSGLAGMWPQATPLFHVKQEGTLVPTWEEFNWGSRGLHYKVGGVIVAHMIWPNTLQVNVYGHDERNAQLLNVFHVRTPDTPDGAMCAAVAGIVGTWVGNSYKNLWQLEISSDRVVVTDVSVVDGDQAEVVSNHSGTLIGTPLPSQNTLAVKKSTGKKGRANRGDWYVWPPSTAQLEELDGNLFLESYRDSCLGELNGLLGNLSDNNFPMVVASQATGLTRVVTTFVAVDRLVDSQNRRGGGRGR